eukprot:gb/GFBE01062210.1/.p1 GENE.gb/GFBE01062210.1/~~gb/GFBE01062210.1/.p1  ORF type:complete len:351 (+),score=60.12 gb/GFBE01062210.1/:1-1053(+)
MGAMMQNAAVPLQVFLCLAMLMSVFADIPGPRIAGSPYELRRVGSMAEQEVSDAFVDSLQAKRRPLMRSENAIVDDEEHHADAISPVADKPFASSAQKELLQSCEFAAWSSWSACSATCNGRRVRVRDGSGLLADYFPADSASAKTAADMANKTSELLQSKSELSMRSTGYILIEKAGRYSFNIGNVSDSRLKIGAAFQLDTAAKQDAVTAAPIARAWLAKGAHSVLFETFGRFDGTLAFLEYSGPDTDDQIMTVPPSVLRHKVRSSCEGSALETHNCNSQGCPVNCAWSEWEAWTNCTKPCSGGSMRRFRKVAIQAQLGGKGCTSLQDGDGSSEHKACNTEPCQRTHAY